MTERLPALKPREVMRALERAGFFLHHVRGSHHYLKHPAKPGVLVVVPFHAKDVKRGTLSSIIRQAGLTTEEFATLL